MQSTEVDEHWNFDVVYILFYEIFYMALFPTFFKANLIYDNCHFRKYTTKPNDKFIVIVLKDWIYGKFACHFKQTHIYELRACLSKQIINISA